jgi:hypothetical protein
MLDLIAGFHPVLAWLAANKDALLPITTILAVVVGPCVQLRIARGTFRMTQAQITSGLYGAADHQWIVDFRQTIADVFALSSNRFHSSRAGLAGREQEERILGGPPQGIMGLEDRVKLTVEFSLLVAKIRLMVPQPDGDELAVLITDMTFNDELGKRSETADLVVQKAKTLIDQREARLASYASLASR